MEDIMSYVDEVISRTIKENPSEVEFHQTLNEVLKNIKTKYVPEYVAQAVNKLNEFFGKYL